MGASVPAWTDQVKDQIAKRYNRFAATDGLQADGYTQARRAGYPTEWLKALPPPVVARYSGCGYALENVDLAGVRIAVDLGCGAGMDALLLSQRLPAGATVVGVDLAPAMLFRLHEAAVERHRAAIHAVAGDIEQLPLRSAMADLVLANASINLTVDKRAAFEEIFRILRPGGRLVARDLVLDSPLPVELALDPVAWNASLGGVVSETDLSASAWSAGLTRVRITDHRAFGPVAAIRLEAVKPRW